ncbi:glycoside hydrolase family 97 protein [Winogradskyella poriferorum]|uniref:Glycoside hydrolase family 97 catalytic domain-containing protein n=1 Tax=Winogradskyella poriferorum TaxID=307627 RepID=A0ABU7W949_9FLAO
MKNHVFALILICTSLLQSCNEKSNIGLFTNPSETIKVNFGLNNNKAPFYKVSYNNKIVLDSSILGIERKDESFYNNLEIITISEPKLVKDHYTMHQGKQKNIEYEANQYIVELQNENEKRINIIFNISDDGVAFKYKFPEASDSIFKIEDEKTTYNFTSNTKAWLQPMSRAKTGWEQVHPSYEEHYISNISVDEKSPIGEGWVYPALFKANDTWLVVSETGLKANYCGTRLMYNEEDEALKVTFPQKEEIFPNGELKPESKTPWETPWRIITIGDLKTVTESTLGTDLANKAIEMGTSFIESGLASWSWALLKDDSVNYETTKEFIDYASDMHWKYCLIDVNWDTTIGDEKMKALADYANSKNVKLIVWYNSSGSWNTTPYHPKSKLLTQEGRETEFKRMNDLGISGVKIDFFGGDGQSMIAYYHDILKDAAKNKLLVNFHGATLPRGWQRTYPHLMTVEAIKGEEFITFDQENADLQASHCAMLPFTRNIFDPMDFTPMVLDSIPGIQRKTTKSFELALPILFLSGIQHIAETPAGMEKQPDFIIEFLKDIPTNWDESKFISGFPGKDVVMARRKGDNWFVVGINGEDQSKTLDLDLSFIKNSKGILYTEKDNEFYRETINSDSLTKIQLKRNDGFVVKF